MIDPANVPPVDLTELLSRYIFSRHHINQQMRSIKADAFMPHPHQELSVTRNRDATEIEVWRIGRHIATTRAKPLIGRGDVAAALYVQQGLRVAADPIPGNPNHANVEGWPANDKPRQKAIAQEIAATATFVEPPQV